MRFTSVRLARSSLARRSFLAATLTASIISVGSLPASAATVTFSATQTIPVPPASTYAGSGGGDGWAVALTTKDVYNVFHHSASLTVACHHQTDGSPCWAPITVTEPSGSGFSAGSQPGLWMDQTTERLYTFSTRTSDQTAGVTCFDTKQAALGLGPFCGFVALSGASESSLDPGFSTLSNPVVAAGKWYAFNFANQFGVGNDSRNKLLCFDLNTLNACGSQPLSLSFGSATLSGNTYPSPAISAMGNRVIVPGPTASGDVLACLDVTTGSMCSGQWPVDTGDSNTTRVGPPFPLLDKSGTIVGICIPNGTDPCWDLSGATVPTPPAMASVITANSGWNGPATVLGPRVYVPNGLTNSVECFDFVNQASCANFPKAMSGLSLMYSLNVDPQRPTCFWVNADNGVGQIQNFDAYTAGACGQGPIRVLASSFVVDTPVCQPGSYTSLQVTSPAPGTYTTGSVSFQDSNGTPIAGAADRTLDAAGTADLSGANLSTALGLPQFLITLQGAGGAPTAVSVKLTWTGTDDPTCVKPGTVVNGHPQDGCSDVVVIAMMGSGQYFTREDDLSPSPQLTALNNAITARAHSSGKTTALKVVNYPATSVDALWAGLKSAKNKIDLIKKLQANVKNYIAGEKYGVQQFSTAVTTVESNCPTAKLLVIGYSQGAMALHDWINSPARAVDPAIVGVGLLADPERVDKSGVLDFGTADYTNQNLIGSHGVCAQVNAAVNCASPNPLKDIAASYAGRTVSVCQQYDIVCDTGTVVNDYPINTQSGRATLLNLAKETHGTYSWLPATKTAGMWLANKAIR